MPRTVSSEEVTQWLIARFAKILEVEPASIGVDVLCVEFGLDSGMVVAISGELEVWLDTRLAPTLLWDCPTILAVAKHIASSDSS